MNRQLQLPPTALDSKRTVTQLLLYKNVIRL